ncbi:MAG TPA: murein L,D-transpeptidase catalytic domain family protein, partial [Candidatus Berkiella sp.]|nr:murein L,D-transpeptidase catalytic domain family protein [Candidatus Berkiella sp.]
KYINEKQILRSATNLHPAALKKAIENYKWVRNNHAIDNPDILTIIDFNLPSNEKRLWVINLKNSQVLFNTFTTHGKNSGLVYAKDFSNTVGTVKSSLGAFKTLSTYQGKH